MRSPRLQYQRYPRYPHPRRRSWLPFILIGVALFIVCTMSWRLLFSSDSSTASSANATPGQVAAKEYPAGELPAGMVFDKLLLEKKERRLTAFHKGVPVRIYYVALGSAPEGHKQFQGDRRTPEGKYTINDKNPNSAYHRNLGISYPNQADREFARKHAKNPGGDIKIHGLAPDFASLGAAHRLTDWTYGCIAVTNPEIEELFTRTPIGTPIEIVP